MMVVTPTHYLTPPQMGRRGKQAGTITGAKYSHGSHAYTSIQLAPPIAKKNGRGAEATPAHACAHFFSRPTTLCHRLLSV